MVFDMKISTLKIISASVALLSGFSVVGFAQNATAQTANFNFSSNVTSSCQFNSAGIGNSVNASSALTQTGNVLSGSNNTVNVNCNFSGGELQITNVSENASNALSISTPANLTATATLTNGASPLTLTANKGTQSAVSTLANGTTNIGLALTADFQADGKILIAGSYSYDVVMTLTNK